MIISALEERNYQLLMELFARSGLEFSEDDPVPTDMVAGWQAIDNGRLAGGCVLARRQGEYIIDGIALDPEYRGGDNGSRLLTTALEHVRSMGGGYVYLVARAPEFFRKHGFETVERGDGPLFFECFNCTQYNVTCFPEVMRIKV